jgi:dipeptidyl aminopeptidase/acylaminoacyl peptidase
VKRETRPYGSWASPITGSTLASGSFLMLPGGIKLDRGTTSWIENRPLERGQNVIMREDPEGRITQLTPQGFNPRSRVYEYGGGDFCASDGVVWFTNFDDLRIYRQEGAAAPEPITPDGGKLFHADLVVDHKRDRLICVREDHTRSDQDAEVTIVGMPTHGRGPATVLASGRDFYAYPRLNPDATRIAWIQWDHPNMPWDGTELWVADLDDEGAVRNPTLVAGGRAESIFQPNWSPQGQLYFISDRTGWWNLYRVAGSGAIEGVRIEDHEFAPPFWWFDTPSYAFANDTIVCSYVDHGLWRLALITPSGDFQPLDLPYTFVSHVNAEGDRAVFLGGTPTDLVAVVELDVRTRKVRTIRRSMLVEIDPSYLPQPEPIEFPTDGGGTAHGFYYAPSNPRFEGQKGQLPPLIVNIHGGPTNAARPSLQFGIQWGAACFWTSHGLAVVDVNYGGSTGYGRAYRDRLKGQWGVVDVADAVNAARWLIDQGRVDGNRVAIRGASSGGYTVLCAIATSEIFKAASSVYGVTDLEALAADTHKFESRYTDGLVPPAMWHERSPVNMVDRMKASIIIHQGLNDKIVPPNQAEAIVSALRRRGVPVEYLAHEGEGHGFRRADSVQRSADAELRFYSKVFGFELAEPDAAVGGAT